MNADDSGVAIVEQFFAEECTDHVRALLLEEISAREHGSRYFTFDRFNVLIDAGSASVTIEDELDTESSWTGALSGFHARLTGGD